MIFAIALVPATTAPAYAAYGREVTLCIAAYCIKVKETVPYLRTQRPPFYSQKFDLKLLKFLVILHVLFVCCCCLYSRCSLDSVLVRPIFTLQGVGGRVFPFFV